MLNSVATREPLKGGLGLQTYHNLMLLLHLLNLIFTEFDWLKD